MRAGWRERRDLNLWIEGRMKLGREAEPETETETESIVA